MNALGQAPLGAEIIASQKPVAGSAPWERAGAGFAAPDDPEAQARARAWEAGAAQLAEQERGNAEAREARRRERAKRREEVARNAAEKLERTARRLCLVGFWALPLVWVVNVVYFWDELVGKKSDEGRPEVSTLFSAAEEAAEVERKERKDRIRRRKS